MKIALVDNMNNNFFSLARYLRDEGIKTDLYVIPNGMEHFHPSADTFQDIKTLKWIKNFPISLNNKTWLIFDKKILSFFKNYDLIISCGISSAYLKRAGIDSDIIIPYGSDLYDLPFRTIKWGKPIDIIRSILYMQQAKYQRLAYKKARCVITNLNNPSYKKAVNKLNINAINSFVPLLYNKEKIQKVEKFNFLDNHDFIVFNHSRQLWCSNPDNLEDFYYFKGNKRNDRIIKAFAKFLKITKFKNPVLVLFEYGPDIECSKKLIEELNIKKFVKWIPKSYRKEILFGLSKASLGINQVRENFNGLGGVSFEVLASGVPLLTHTNGLFDNKNSIFYNAPIIDVLSEEDLLEVFVDYEKHPKKYKEIGKKSKEWFDKNLGEGLAKKYVKLIDLLVSDKSLTQNDKKIRGII
jgi:glycosyltransferase involved in cell wall biosynthesis